MKDEIKKPKKKGMCHSCIYLITREGGFFHHRWSVYSCEEDYVTNLNDKLHENEEFGCFKFKRGKNWRY